MKTFRKAAVLALAALCLPVSAPAATPENAGTAFVLEHVRLIDLSGSAADVREDARVVVRDGRIASVAQGSAGPAEAGLRRIDGTGLTLLPGLTDMHVHVWDEVELGAYLGAGVTTVRNMSGMPFHLDMARRIDAGTLAGPRLITTGPILNSKGPNSQINHQVVETAEDARKAVRWQYRAGFRRLKVYSNLRPAPYAAIVSEARALGMTVSGHTPEGFRHEGVPKTRPFDIAFTDVLDDGFETIEHSESIVWHGLSDRHDEAAAVALARRIAASGTPVTPTLIAHHNLYRMAETKGGLAQRPGTGMLNPIVLKTRADMVAFWSKQEPGWVRENDRFIGVMTRAMHDAGVLLVAGSDAGIFANIPGVSLHDELELLVKAGLSPYAALRSATRNAAVVLGESGTRGCVTAGCHADLVLYRCDPLAAIECVRNPAMVVRGGRLYDRKALAAMLETARHPNVDRTARNLVSGMAAQGTPLDPAVLGM